MAPAIGIDLGTTNTCAAIFLNGKTTIIRTKTEKYTTPSFVYYSQDQRVVGDEAVKKSVINPANGVFGIKRLLGKRFQSKEVQEIHKTWPFHVTESKDKQCQIEISLSSDYNLKISPEEVSAAILKKIKDDAEAFAGEIIEDAVITVPAYFLNQQRQATFDAARIAGLHVLKIINEPTAAALAFERDSKIDAEKIVLVYDLGGGTFDVSLLKMGKDKGDVIAIKGDSNLGGEDFTRRLQLFICEQIENKYDLKIDDLESELSRGKALRKIRVASEEIKKRLSHLTSTIVELEGFCGFDITLEISRDDFDRINDDLFEDTMNIVREALDVAKLSKNDVDTVILVGGSTRVKKIQTLLSDFFGDEKINKSVNPDEAVALGAALQAHYLTINPSKSEDSVYELFDVTPLPLGVEIASNQSMDVLIPANTKIPAIRKRSYFTLFDYQDMVVIKVYEGLSSKVEENDFLGEFVVRGFQMKAAGVEIVIQFAVNRNGILKITAEEEASNVRKSLNISLFKSGRLKEEELNAIVHNVQEKQ